MFTGLFPYAWLKILKIYNVVLDGAAILFLYHKERKLTAEVGTIFNSWVRDSVETICSGHFGICKLARTLRN